MLQPVTLPADTLHALLQAIPANAEQSHKLVSYLASNPLAPSAEVTAATGATNLANVAHRVNRALYEHGLMIGCQKSPAAAAAFQWAVYAVGGAA
jgi:hypothetical protein